MNNIEPDKESPLSNIPQTDLPSQVAKNTEAIKTLKRRQEHLDESYFGNGKIGLRTWVMILTTLILVMVCLAGAFYFKS